MAYTQTPTDPANLYSPANRYQLYERFARLPALNADVGISKNTDFELLGTNAASAGATYAPEGGLLLTTAGAATDSLIVLPHLDAAQTAWAGVTWGTDRETWWGCHIRTPAALTNRTYWAGLKLTNTPVITTDANQVMFRYQNGTDTTWRCISSIADSDTDASSGVTVEVATDYRFEIRIDASRVAHFFINGEEKATSAALTDAIDLIPYIGVLSATDASAKTLVVRSTWISRAAA